MPLQSSAYPTETTEALQARFDKRAESLRKLFTIISSGQPGQPGHLHGNVGAGNFQSELRCPITLAKAHNKLVRELKSLRCRLSPSHIRKLPLELLIEVFAYVLEDEVFYKEASMITLMQVCRKWECVILGTRSLWVEFWETETETDTSNYDIYQLMAGSTSVLAMERVLTWDAQSELRGTIYVDDQQPFRILSIWTVLNDEERNSIKIVIHFDDDVPPNLLTTLTELYKWLTKPLYNLNGLLNFHNTITELVVNRSIPSQNIMLESLRDLFICSRTTPIFLEKLIAPSLRRIRVYVPFEGSPSNFRAILRFAAQCSMIESMTISRNYVVAWEDCWSDQYGLPFVGPINYFLIIGFRAVAPHLRVSKARSNHLYYPFSLTFLSPDLAQVLVELKISVLESPEQEVLLYLEHLQTLEVQSSKLRETFDFLEHIKAPVLRSLTLLPTFELPADQSDVDAYYINGSDFSLLEELNCLWPNLRMEGRWCNVIKSSIFVDWLPQNSTSLSCYFPQIRSLLLSGEPGVLCPNLTDHLTAIFNLETLTSLQFCPNGSFVVDLDGFVSLETIEVNGSDDLALLDYLIETLIYNPTHLPNLHTLTMRPFPSKWMLFCSFILRRAHQSLLGEEVTPITSVYLAMEPPIQYLGPLQAALRGEIFPGSDIEKEKYDLVLANCVCSWCSEIDCFNKHWCQNDCQGYRPEFLVAS